MNIISGIGESGFLAHSALSAEVATKDSLGRNISETYLTGVDLTPYQTTAGMTAYQSAGDYASSTDLANYQPVSSMTAYQEAGDYYSASNPSGFITGVGDTYLQNSDLTISDGKITEISGVPLSAGDEFPSSANEACEVVTANSAEWNKVTGLSGYVRNDTRWLDIGVDNYIETINAASQPVYDSFAFGYKNSAANIAVSMGNANSAGTMSLTQGSRNSAFKNSFAQGSQNYASGVVAGNNSNGSFTQGFKNSAYSGSFAQGSYNVASGYSFAQGGSGSNSNSAIKHSFAQGSRCVASAGSFAQGNQCHAEDYSIAQGGGAVASSYSQAFGQGTIAYSSGMAIGAYNETDSAAFVIGNGENASTRSDAFIVYHDGSVSAAGKISANGVELGAGSEIPAGTMNTSALEYNAVNEISGYNGSAIAQYGAEKQWLQHDDTIVHVSNSAQYAFGVNISAVAQLLGVDETVLWSGEKNTTAGAEALSESYMNFNKIDIYLTFDTASNPQRAQSITRYYVGNHTTAQPLYVYATANNIAGNILTAETLYISGSPVGTGFSLLGGTRQVNSTVTTGITSYNCRLVEIRGIGRKQ